MIEIRQHVVPQSRTSTGSLWEASTEIDRKTYSASSRHGAPQALARVLVAAGIPDQPVEVRSEERPGCIRYRSLYEMTKWTFTEGTSTLLHRVRYQEQPKGVFSVEASGQETRFTPPAGILASEDPAPPEVDAPKCVSCGRDFHPARRWSIFCSPACRLRAHRRARRDDSQKITAVSEPAP
jgi:ferredoxin